MEIDALPNTSQHQKITESMLSLYSETYILKYILIVPFGNTPRIKAEDSNESILDALTKMGCLNDIERDIADFVFERGLSKSDYQR